MGAGVGDQLAFELGRGQSEAVEVPRAQTDGDGVRHQVELESTRSGPRIQLSLDPLGHLDPAHRRSEESSHRAFDPALDSALDVAKSHQKNGSLKVHPLARVAEEGDLQDLGGCVPVSYTQPELARKSEVETLATTGIVKRKDGGDIFDKKYQKESPTLALLTVML